MPTLATSLIQFLMNLFNNPDAAKEFLEDPEQALEDAGLGRVCTADVDAVMPVVLDYAPISVDSSFDREYNTGGNTAWTGSHGGGEGDGGGQGGHGGGGGGHHPDPHDNDDHAHAVQQLHHVVNNYSYTSSVDDRDTVTDLSVNQNIWADGDVTQLFENEAIIASGDGAMIAGGDIAVDNSVDNSEDNSQDHSLSVVAGDDADVAIGNTDLEVDVDDSFNTDKSIDDSYNTVDSYNTDVEVDIEDSLNDSSDHSVDNSDHSVNTDVDIEESFNKETTDVGIDDSFNKETTEVDVDIEESFNKDNSVNTDVTVDDIEAEFTHIDDSVVLANNEGDLEVDTEITETPA
jgi:hypothetical protein